LAVIQVSTDELMTCREQLQHYLPRRISKRPDANLVCLEKAVSLQDQQAATWDEITNKVKEFNS